MVLPGNPQGTLKVPSPYSLGVPKGDPRGAQGAQMGEDWGVFLLFLFVGHFPYSPFVALGGYEPSRQT